MHILNKIKHNNRLAFIIFIPKSICSSDFIIIKKAFFILLNLKVKLRQRLY